MVSAMKGHKDFLSSFKKGCEFYIWKPFTPEKIKEALKQCEMLK